jgi:hypothetical protein
MSSSFDNAWHPPLVTTAVLGVGIAVNIVAIVLFGVWLEGLGIARRGTGCERLQRRLAEPSPSDRSIDSVVMTTLAFVLACAALYRALFVVDPTASAGTNPHRSLGALDAIYFRIVALATVGYGDFAPAAHC